MLSVVVRSDGTLRDIHVLKSVGYGMDERAIETVQKWRFRAGSKNGIPVDVRIQLGVGFRLAAEANTWGGGPLAFDLARDIRPPVLKSGTMPKAVRETGDETVVLQFRVGRDGKVGEISPLQGRNSASLPALVDSLSKWEFQPASKGSESLPVTGKVLLIKGEDQFRYNVSSAFRDTGTLPSKEQKPSDLGSLDTSTANSEQIVTVIPKLSLERDEAQKQLVHRVPAQYPAKAKLAGIQGTVLLAVTIGVDGRVKDLREISGPPELISAATDAVKQWRYRPTVFRGRTWEVSTEVEIQFRLPE
jgi:TonB family protein